MAEVIQIDSRTWRLEDSFVRFFLLEGEDRAALIDSGMNSADARSIAEKLCSKPLILMNTHGDPDHSSGTGSFSEIYMHEKDYYGCDIASKFPGTVLHKLEEGDIIELGGRPIRAIHIPGHTKGSLAFLDVKARTLYAGDSVSKAHIYMFGDKREPEKFCSSLDKLISMQSEYDRIYASHDEYLLPKDYAENVKEAWLAVRNGDVPFTEIDLFGNKAKSYTTDSCGFLMK